MSSAMQVGHAGVNSTLHEALADLTFRTSRGSIAIGSGQVFDYFDELRRRIEEARADIFFVDPYLDADVVSRYFPFIAAGVSVRLLAREKLKTLAPATKAFAAQSGLSIEIRSAPSFHDRYLFVDKTRCFQSGASFKDGARSTPTVLSQISDAFDAMLSTYETMWNAGAPVT